VSLEVVSTVRRNNVQFFTKRRFSALFWPTRTSPGANFHIGGRVCIQLFTYEIMSEIIGLTHAKDCDVYSLWKASLCATFWLTWTWMCPHANFLMRGRVCIQLVPYFLLSKYNFASLGSVQLQVVFSTTVGKSNRSKESKYSPRPYADPMSNRHC